MRKACQAVANYFMVKVRTEIRFYFVNEFEEIVARSFKVCSAQRTKQFLGIV